MHTTHRRLTAGLWYAMAAMLPGMLFIHGLMPRIDIRADHFVAAHNEVYWVFVCLPALAGLLAGGLCAEKYNQPVKNIAISNWVWRGLLVAFVAHTFFVLLWAIWSAIVAQGSYINAGGYVFMTEFIGLAWFGWLEAIMGSCGGWLLGCYRKKKAVQEATPNLHRLPALSFPLRVLLCLLILLAIAVAFFMMYLHVRGAYA